MRKGKVLMQSVKCIHTSCSGLYYFYTYMINMIKLLFNI